MPRWPWSWTTERMPTRETDADRADQPAADRRGPEALTDQVRRAANLVGIAVVIWLVLFFLSSEIGEVRAISPWSEDPADLVVSLTFLLLGVVGPVTFVRVQQDVGRQAMRARTADDVIRGLFVAVGAVALADAIMLIASVQVASSGAGGSWGRVLAFLLGLSVATIAVAAFATIRAARATGAWRESARDEDRDALDDFQAWTAHVRPLLPVHRSVTAWLAGPFSPRRHRWRFAIGVALAFGLSYSAWHLLVEGPAPSVSAAVTILLVFAAFGAAAVMAGWIAFGRYLRLIRSAAT